MDMYQYNQYTFNANDANNDNQKLADLKTKLKVLEKINDLQAAREAVEDILPLDRDFTKLYIGNAECTVTNRKDRLVICIDSKDDFICYSYE